MISRELNSADSRFAKICSTALRSVFCSSKPKTVAPISPASQKKVESQGFRQKCALLDKDGARFDGVWHFGLSPRRLSWRIVRQQRADG